jgi:hypothetical protein
LNSKERFLSAVKFKGVDRLPCSFRATSPLSKRLFSFLNIPETSGLSARRALLDVLGADFWSSGSKIDALATFVPTYEGEKPQQPFIEDKSLFYTLGIGVVLGQVDAYHFDYPVYTRPPLATVQSPNELGPHFLTSKLDQFDFHRYINKASSNRPGQLDPNDPLQVLVLEGSKRDFICIGTLNNIFMICCYLRGMEQFLMDMVSDKRIAEAIIGEVSEFCLEFCRREMENFGDHAEFYGSFDDLAGQNGIMFSPTLFKTYFLPYYKKLIAMVKDHGLIFSWHCCGSVHAFLADMIEAGIDIFDVVQTSAKDMDVETLYRRYGNQVCFHGAVDVQKLLVSGKPNQVRDEIRRIRDLWGLDGGMVVAPSHEMVPETPIENIMAMYDALRDVQ